jgi:hypothetical protein
MAPIFWRREDSSKAKPSTFRFLEYGEPKRWEFKVESEKLFGNHSKRMTWNRPRKKSALSESSFAKYGSPAFSLSNNKLKYSPDIVIYGSKEVFGDVFCSWAAA